MSIKKELLTILAVLAALPATGVGGPILLPRGEQTTWSYLDGAGAPAEGWQSVDFDDSGWKRGRGPLGYGESNLGTTLGFGGDEEDKHMSVYCRTSFMVNPVQGKKLEALGVLLRRDDGAVVYLNGREVIRSNMEPGKVVFTTPAASATGPADEATYHRYMVPVELLAKGEENTANTKREPPRLISFAAPRLTHAVWRRQQGQKQRFGWERVCRVSEGAERTCVVECKRA